MSCSSDLIAESLLELMLLPEWDDLRGCELFGSIVRMISDIKNPPEKGVIELRLMLSF